MRTSSKNFLQKANVSNTEFLWYLRNQPDVYKYSRQNRAVSWKEHLNWIFPILLGLNNKKLFLIKNFQMPIGQVKFDWEDQREAKVSISL